MSTSNHTLATLTLTNTSKLPCRSFDVTALACKVGSKLAQVEGSVCFKCYALGGFYRMPNVASANQKRLNLMKQKGWAETMIAKIRKEETSGFFRWFSSGDLQSLKNLRDIVRIAIALPEMRFWLPTKEYGIVSEYFERYGPFPENITVRLSAYMINKAGPDSLAITVGLTTSEVHSNESAAIGTQCPSSIQGNKCLDCRACWSKDVQTVVYRLH
jgi:hypothetical protein